MGLGMGFAMANQMANSFGQQTPQGAPAGPPPIPGQTSYFVAVNGQQTGPFAPGLLKQQAQQGALTAETLVWAQGMASWVAAGQVPELAGIFQQGPPPLPE
jgi:hypothetical protein